MTLALLQAPSDIPPEVIPILGIVFGSIMTIVLGLPIIRACVRWFERRTERPPLPHNLEGRLDRIEQTMDSIAVEIERIGEAQRYLTRLQTEARPLDSGQQPPR
jgi:hypothetical protein